MTACWRQLVQAGFFSSHCLHVSFLPIVVEVELNANKGTGSLKEVITHFDSSLLTGLAT
jgi:hypothetical protein